MSKDMPRTEAGQTPDYITEREFFEEREVAWHRGALARDIAATAFTDKIGELFDNNPDARFITLQRVDDKSFTKPLEEIWKSIREAKQSQHLSEAEIEEQVAFFQEGLKAAVRNSEDLPTPSYNEHLYLSNPDRGLSFIVARRLTGGEISSWKVPNEPHLWTPPEVGSLSTTHSAIRYTTVDEQGRKVPVSRQRKEFFDRLGDEQPVQYREDKQLPNPSDYGTNKVAQHMLQRAIDYVLNHPGRLPYDVDHHTLNLLIADLEEAEVEQPSLGPPPILQYTLRRKAEHDDRWPFGPPPTLPPDPPDPKYPKNGSPPGFDEQFKAIGF